MGNAVAPPPVPTRVHVNRDGPAWRVTLAGDLVKNAVEADSAEGWVRMYVTDRDGHIMPGRLVVARGPVTIAPDTEWAARNPLHTGSPWNRPHWWHRTISGLTLAACAVGFAGVCWVVCWLTLVVVLGGCAVGYPLKPDGTADTNDAIIGISTGTANAAGAGLLSLGGLLSGNPAIVGLAALVANQVGKRQGWDEHSAEKLKERGIVATTEKTL